MKAIITVGISGSGKSTFAEQKCRKDRNWVNINRDSLRFMLTGAGSNGWNGYRFNRSIEAMVTGLQQDAIEAAITQNKNVILSDTNLNPQYRKAWEDMLSASGYEVEIKEFPIDLMEAIKRDRFRGNFSVGRDVIFKQWQQWLDYIDRKRYIPNEDMPSAICVDLDGTLCSMDGKRSPYEWSKVYGDSTHEEVLDMVNGYSDLGYTIIALSGRDGCCEQDSRKWLIDKGVQFDEFFIRRAGDKRKDTVVKEEIFWDSIATRYNVKAVVDDHPSVCRNWRDIGLKVIQVGDPHVEF